VFTVPLIGERPELDLNAVVYGTDFSVFSQNAGLYAAFLASHFSTALMVAHAFTLSQAAMEAEIDPSLVSQQRKDLDFLLSRKAAALSHGSVKATPVLLQGDPKQLIPELAAALAPSLVVLGTHGGKWLVREIVGSVAEGILRSTSWPVLTVGPQVPSAAEKHPVFQHILYATDLTPAAAGAAVYAVSFARAFRADIDVLHVVPREAIDHPDRLSDIRNRFYRALDNVVPDQAKDFCNPRAFVDVGNAHRQILENIRERSVDLLVLGIRKSSHLGIETRTSRAFELIVHATCPVLTIVG
jgi:nucleotide-binding universal stress UspA family protein